MKDLFKYQNIQKIKVSELLPIQGTFKELSKKNFGKLKNSISKNGFIQPFFIWENENKKYILDGHQRQKAIIDLYGDIFVSCIVIDAKNLQEAKKLVLFYSSQYGEFSKESFLDFGSDLQFPDIEDFSFPGFSFNADDFLNVGNQDKDDEIPEVAQNELGVQLGDIYTLGDHRLMCGDSIKDINALLLGQEVDMVFTDPPYGMDYNGRGQNTSVKIIGDQADPSHLYAAAFNHSDEVYLWGRMENYNHLPKPPRDVIVWKKNNIGMGAGYRGQYEVCFYYGNFKGSDSDVWEVKRDTDYTHPTQKPVELAQRAILNSKPKTVLDLFGGSGSTLIACEKTKRKCYMMELDPHYCSVIIKRWEKFTGQKAVKCE